MKFIINTLVEQMINNNIIESKMEQEYFYALEVFFEKLIIYISILIISVYLDLLIPTLIFLVFFCGLRSRTGGYHLNTYLKCFIGTVGIYVMFAKWLYPWLDKNINYIFLILFFSLVFIFVIGAVNHPNINWSKTELEETKKASRVMLFLQCISIISFTVLGVHKDCIIFATLGVMLCAILLIAAKICKQEVRE